MSWWYANWGDYEFYWVVGGTIVTGSVAYGVAYALVQAFKRR